MNNRLRDFFRGQESDGQALAEFAIAFPFQLFITFGLIQMMLLMTSSLVVNFAAYRCARAAVVNYNSAQEVKLSDETYTLEEYIKPVAQITLAPLAFHSTDNSADIFVPGWGGLRGSGAAAAKIVLKFSSQIKGNEELITTQLTFKQELLVPFVDRILQMILPSANKGEGKSFAGASEANGGIEVMDSVSGRKLVHYLITRQHIMRREANIDAAPGSSVYEYK